jgi:glutathione S-transferase
MATITVSAFRWVPPFAQGLVRDLRVRWALEEAGVRYKERLIGPEDQRSVSYRRLQPFGQVPAYEEDGLVLFESGAIVLHVAERSPVLMPADPAGRARVTTWAFAALNSVERRSRSSPASTVLRRAGMAKQRRPGAVEAVQSRLTDLSAWLDGREYLEDRFTAADLLMATVLRILQHTDLVAQTPHLGAYLQRCEARPAFKKALADQLAPFAESERLAAG